MTHWMIFSWRCADARSGGVLAAGSVPPSAGTSPTLEGFAPSTRPYAVAADHVFLGLAGAVADAHAVLAPRVTDSLLDEVVALVPDLWLVDEPGFGSPDDVRARYREVLLERVAGSAAWLPDVEERRAARV